jgi:hypothetical protein
MGVGIGCGDGTMEGEAEGAKEGEDEGANVGGSGEGFGEGASEGEGVVMSDIVGLDVASSGTEEGRQVGGELKGAEVVVGEMLGAWVNAPCEIVGFLEKAGLREGELVGKVLGASVGDFVASSEMVGCEVKVNAGERDGENVGGWEEVGGRVESLFIVGLRLDTVGEKVGEAD